MLNKNDERMLAYVEQVTSITPIEKADRLEAVHINGWTCVCGKGEFKVGDLGVFFEIDSSLPEERPFSDMEFLADKHFKITTQRIRGCISQGLFMPLSAFEGIKEIPQRLHSDCTELLGVTYAVAEDNKRKTSGKKLNVYENMIAARPELFQKLFVRKMMKKKIGRKILLFIFDNLLHKDAPDMSFPSGKFTGVKKTDQERVENMTWVLQDKTPYIVTQKCDGSSATYILERKQNGKFEFYVCSRNRRLVIPDTSEFWKCANKYCIREHMEDWMKRHPDCRFVCWQGEVCSPTIQGNPHHLKDTHLYLFHMTDSITGRFDIRYAEKIWKEYGMEVVPIVNTNYILPDDFEEFKLTADGVYDKSVCEGQAKIKREGFVYYKTTDPNSSFKNVSRSYLLKH